jgi:uncharacterized protein (TIGR00251 family)
MTAKKMILNHNCCRIAGDEIHIAIKALPGASKTEFAGVQEQYLRVRIAAAPEDGRANAELIAFIAKSLGCSKREVRLLRGTQSRQKTIAVPLSYRVQLETILMFRIGLCTEL